MSHEPDSVESNHGLPPELMGRTPRRVQVTGTGWLNVFAAALFILLGAAWAVATIKLVHDETTKQTLLQKDGATASGKIIQKWTHGSGTYISYSFAIDQTPYSGKSKVPFDTWNGLHQADSLPIRYLPANPDLNHPAAWEDSTSSKLWLLWITAFLAIFGSLFVRRFPLQLRLAKMGIPVRGCIAEQEWTGPTKGQKYIPYTFRNADSGEVEIGSCPYDDELKAGTTVCVLYLPANPRRSEIYPFGIDLVRVVP